MQRTPVTSNTIRDIGYDPVARTLEIGFRTGSVYQYYRVPSGVHIGLMVARSHGSYVALHVQKHYLHRRVA